MITFKYNDTVYGITGVKSSTVFARKVNGGGKLVRGRDHQFERNEIEKILGKSLEDGYEKAVEDEVIPSDESQILDGKVNIVIYAQEVNITKSATKIPA